MIVSIVIGLAALALMGYLCFRVLRELIRWRGIRLVRCPENAEQVAVHVDAAHAAASGVLHSAELRLDACTRWPEKQNCGQECLQQIHDAPEDCLLRNVAVNWYHDKQCAYCGRQLGEFRWPDFRSALRLPDGKTVEWQQIAPEQLPSTLAQARPVCWNCHIAQTFRREHPDLVTDR
jgi:ssDNA-binding Zn-finger/Zn-ribbon topoisomerase 1